MAQYREAVIFEQFGSDLDSVTKFKLVRGVRLVEILIQKAFSPMAVEDQIITIYAGLNGFLDSMSIEEVVKFKNSVASLGHDDKYWAALKSTMLANNFAFNKNDEIGLKLLLWKRGYI